MKTKSILTKIIYWRLFILAAATVGLSLLPFKDSFPYRQEVLEPYGHPLLYSWGNFDGVHYLGIAQTGYSAQFTQAFFPLYPLLIRFTNFYLHNYLLSALFISHLFLFFAIKYLYKLVSLDFSSKTASKTVLLLLLFPTSYYFGSAYTESVFLFLVVSSLYYMRTKHPIKAIFLAALAGATRIVGIFLLPALLYEHLLQSKGKKNPTLLSYAPFLLSSAGLLSYMTYLHLRFQNAFYFLTAQPAFGP